MTENDDFTIWIKGRRQALRMTQADLGNKSGYAPETIRAVEAGRRKPSRQMVERLATTLQLHAEQRARFCALGLGLPLPPAPKVPLAATRPPTRYTLQPLKLPPLLGRAALLAQLKQRLQAPDLRLLTLVGPPGVGKSRLAREVAHALERQLTAGAVWVPLAGVRSVEQLLLALAQALNLILPPTHSLRQVVFRTLQPCALLLVLDSIEQLRPEAEQLATLLAELLATAPHIRLLVTSQAALQLAIEQVVVVPPLATEAMPAQPAPALQLFVQRAQALDPGFTLTAQNQPLVAAICRELDGLPLALELAATRCRLFTLEELLTRLDDRLALLSHQSGDRERRHHSLRAALEWSVALLSPAEQTFLGALSLFHGGFSLAAAEAVGGAAAATLALLEQLLNQSLISRVAATPPPRFAMLESIRLFAHEQLATATLAAYARSHAAYYLSYAQQKAPPWGQEAADWVEAVACEEANLHAALGYTLAHRDAERLAALVVTLSPYWVQQGRGGEGRRWAAAALALAGVHTAAEDAKRLPAIPPSPTTWARGPGGEGHPVMPPELLAQLLVAAADLAYEQSDYAAAAALAQRVATLDDALVASTTLLRAHYRSAWVAARQGNYEAAQTILQQAMPLAQGQGDPYNEAMLSGALGWLARDQGDFAEARRAQQRSLTLYRQLGDRLSVAYTLNALGALAREQGDYAKAEQAHREALQLYQATKHPSGVALSYNSLAWVAGMRGATEHAALLFARSLDLREALGNDRACAWTLSDLGWLWREAGDIAQATAYYHAAFARYQQIGERRGCALSALSLAQVSVSQGELAQAKNYLSSACETLVTIRDQRSLARLLEVAAAYAHAQGATLVAAERLGAAEALRTTFHAILPASEERWYHNLNAQLNATAAPGIAAAWAAGATRTLEHLLADIAPAYLDLQPLQPSLR